MLRATRCPTCRSLSYPPRDGCPNCGAAPTEDLVIDGAGSVVAATWVPGRFPIDGFGGADGYGVAWVDVDDGPRVQALIADAAPLPDVRGAVDVVVLGGVPLPVFEVAST